MAHVRQEILSRTAVLVSTGGFVGGVTTWKRTPFADGDLPNANITWEEDSIEDTQFGNQPSTEIVTRTGELAIEVRAKEIGGIAVWATLNLAAEEIEKVIVLNSYTSAGLPLQDLLLAASAFEITGEQDQDSGMLRMAYAVRYKYSSLDPSVLIP